MGDERAKYLRRLRRLRRSARRWTVLAGTLGGATLILVPYSGLGVPDAFWAAAAGGSAALAYWRHRDARELAAQPVPEPGNRYGVLARVPVARAAFEEFERRRTAYRLRGSSVAVAWQRLDVASLTLGGLAARLGGPAAPAVQEAAVAERSLRELAERTASVERALRLAPADQAQPLTHAHAALVSQLDSGVGAYEHLVAAAAGYVAEDGRSGPEHPAVARLREATDLLRGIAAGLSELRAY